MGRTQRGPEWGEFGFFFGISFFFFIFCIFSFSKIQKKELSGLVFPIFPSSSCHFPFFIFYAVDEENFNFFLYKNCCFSLYNFSFCYLNRKFCRFLPIFIFVVVVCRKIRKNKYNFLYIYQGGKESRCCCFVGWVCWWKNWNHFNIKKTEGGGRGWKPYIAYCKKILNKIFSFSKSFCPPSRTPHKTKLKDTKPKDKTIFFFEKGKLLGKSLGKILH